MRWTLRTLLVATAVLLLGLKVAKQLVHRPLGLYVKLVAHTPSSSCGDSSVVVLEVLNDRSFRINSERVPIENLGEQLRKRLLSRAERVLLIRGDSEVSVQEAVTAIGIARGAISNLYVALLTPEAEKEPCFYITRPQEFPTFPQ